MKILLIGYGRLGKALAAAADESGDEVVGIFRRANLDQLAETGKIADVVIDVSRPEALPAIEEYIRRTGLPLVSGTTRYSEEEFARLRALGELAPVLWSANFSVGMSVLCRALREISDVLKPDFDIELTEALFRQKDYAPSDTTRRLLQAIDPKGEYVLNYGRHGDCGGRTDNEIGVHSLRGGNVASIYSVHFFGLDEELELTHRAAGSRVFARGALTAARRLVRKPKGLYDLDALLFDGVERN